MVVNPNLKGNWNIDASHTRIGFSARHAMVTRIRGAFNEVKGFAYIDPENWDSFAAEVSIRVDSIDTRNVQRDDHLCGVDFFDANKYPTIDFASTSIDEVGESQFIILGDLTMHGVTKAVSIPLDLAGIQEDMYGNIRAGLEGGRRLDRREWGISWNSPLDTGGVMVSEKLSLEFEISLIKEQS